MNYHMENYHEIASRIQQREREIWAIKERVHFQRAPRIVPRRIVLSRHEHEAMVILANLSKSNKQS